MNKLRLLLVHKTTHTHGLQGKKLQEKCRVWARAAQCGLLGIIMTLAFAIPISQQSNDIVTMFSSAL